MPKTKQRPYKSLVRQRQAEDTRRRIVEATRQLLQSEGYAGMTIEAIAQRAEVSAQSVYAIFKSKTGILIALLDQSTFGSDYEKVVRQAVSESDPETRLRLAAGVARQIRGAQSAAFDLMRGAGVVAPVLAKLQHQRERLRYEKEKGILDAYRRGCVPHAGVGASVVSTAVPGLAGRHFGALPARHGEDSTQLRGSACCSWENRKFGWGSRFPSADPLW